MSVRGAVVRHGDFELGLNVVVWFLCIPLPPVMVAQGYGRFGASYDGNRVKKSWVLYAPDFASVNFYLLSLHTTLSPTAPLKRSLSI